MSKPKLSTKTPDNDKINNLIGLHPQLIAQPNERRIAIVELGVRSVNHVVADGEDQATVYIRQVEVLAGKDATDAEKIFTRAYSNRTGEHARPAPDEPSEPIANFPDTEDTSDAVV
jgi:hypothetical protein